MWSWGCSHGSGYKRVVVFAVEADAVRTRHLWPRSLVPPPLTDADKAYYTDAVRAETQRPEQRLDIQYVSTDTTAERHDGAALSTDTTRLD